VLSHVLLHKLDAQIGVVNALDFVTDTRNYAISSAHGSDVHSVDERTQFVCLPRLVDKLARCETRVPGTGEHGSSFVESATKAATDSEEAGREG